MNICGIDFETTGLDPKKDRITEIGAIVWNENYDVLAEFQTMVYERDYPKQTDIVIKLTGITDEMLTSQGAIPPRLALTQLNDMMMPHDIKFMVAHNAPFDRAFLKADVKRQFGEGEPWKTSWLDTMRDIEYPVNVKCRKLSHVALDLGIMVDPKTLHRSLGDVRVMGKVLKEFDIKDIIDFSRQDWIYLQAQIPPPWIGRGGDGGVGKAAASKVGFSWEKARATEGPTFPKKWVIRVKESKVDEITEALNYPVIELKREKNENT